MLHEQEWLWPAYIGSCQVPGAWAERWKLISAKPPGLCGFICWVANCTKPRMWWSEAVKKKIPLVALRDMFQVRLPAGCFRLVPAPSAEKLSWGTSVSISHMSNVTSEATIQERVVWGSHSSDFPLNLCIWCFTGAVSQLSQLLAQCAFWWWDWSWQSLGCWVWAVTWLGDKEATRPLYFTL